MKLPLLYHPDGERGGTLPPGEGEPAARPPANQSCLARPPIWESEPRGGGGGKERESTAHLPPSQLCLPSPPVQSGPEMLPLGCCVGRGASSAFFLGPPVSMRGLELGSWLGRLSPPAQEQGHVWAQGSCPLEAGGPSLLQLQVAPGVSDQTEHWASENKIGRAHV